MRHRHEFAILAAMLMAIANNAALGADAPPGASACSGCHPASRGVESAVPRLVGRDAAQLVSAMAAFRSGQRPSTVMDRIAKGFTDDEVKAIAAWYAAQKD
jgi:cytochrome subunit of sulfide dehydrogenase